MRAGKRAFSSTSSAIVLRDGKPILALGAAGGPTVITQTVINLVGVLDLGLRLDDALAQKRFHHQWQPDELRIEKNWPDPIKQQLRKLGHKMAPVQQVGASNAVGQTDGLFFGASEPRVPGHWRAAFKHHSVGATTAAPLARIA